MRRAKLICTVGPASREPDTLRQLVQAGMDVARLNFSHGDHASHAEDIACIRAVAANAGRPVAILADLQGPKLRVGTMAEEGVVLREGELATLTTRDVVGRSPQAVPVQYDELPKLVEPGDPIFLDDGLLELEVLCSENTEIRCRVIAGGVLQSNKGMNLPRASPDIPAITAKDRSDLAFALAEGVDWVALSFVRAAAEVQELKRLIRDLGSHALPPPVMAKIEKPEALENLDAIIAASDGIMVARGDLGVEIPSEDVPVAQKQIIARCNHVGVPVVVATQMLESMIRSPRPTRAEASDVANAVLDGADAVMLSGETSIGAYPVRAVRTMTRIVEKAETARGELTICPFQVQGELVPSTVANAVSLAARVVAQDLRAAAIIALTASGHTARLVSRHRPRVPIVAVTPSQSVQRQLALCWGVTPLLAPRTDNTDNMIAYALQTAREHGLVKAGETVVVTAGAAGSAPGTTNLIRVLTVDAPEGEPR